MKKKSLFYSADEIDLIDIFMFLWRGKITILLITTISFLIGYGFYNQVPNNYLNSLTIKKNKNFEFIRIASLKRLIGYSENEESKNFIQLNQEIMNRFVIELMDYEEFLLSVENLKKPIEDNSDLSSNELYLNSFNIVEDDTGVTLNLIWNNADEAKKILQNTINLTLNNLEKSIFDELIEFVEVARKIRFYNDQEEIDYLSEQSYLARELGIKKNEMNNVTLDRIDLLILDNKQDADYLKGYKALEKEIYLIKNREYEKFEFFKQEINSVTKIKFQWVLYNINKIKVKLLNDTKLNYLVISIMLGLLAGIIIVLIPNTLKFYRVSKKN